MSQLKTFIYNNQSKKNIHIITNNYYESIIIDAPLVINQALDYIANKNFDLRAVFLTSAYYDCIEGIDHLISLYPNIKIYMQKADYELFVEQKKINDADGSVVSKLVQHIPRNLILLDGDTVVNEIGLQIEVFKTSLLTPGSQILRISQLNLIIGTNNKEHIKYLSNCNEEYVNKFVRKLTSSSADKDWLILPWYEKTFYYKKNI